MLQVLFTFCPSNLNHIQDYHFEPNFHNFFWIKWIWVWMLHLWPVHSLTENLHYPHGQTSQSSDHVKQAAGPLSTDATIAELKYYNHKITSACTRAYWFDFFWNLKKDFIYVITEIHLKLIRRKFMKLHRTYM